MRTASTEKKIEEIRGNIAEIKTILAGQAVQLTEHIRRTTLLEDSMKPVQAHVAMVNGALKLVGVMALIASAIGAVWACFLK